MRKSRKRIHGNDRAIMMLWRDARKRWMQYGENRTKKDHPCLKCGEVPTQPDHIKAIGARPKTEDDFGPKLKKLLRGKCQPLCQECNRSKADVERKRRKQNG